MAQITRERTASIQKGILEILSRRSEPIHVNQVLEELETILPSNEYEQGTYETTGGIRRPKIVRFSTIGLVKAGWIQKNKGSWSITQEGRDALIKFPTALEINAEQLKLYRIWRDSQPGSEDPEDEPEGRISSAISIEEAESESFTLVENYLAGINPYEFQNLVKSLLEGMGYRVSWVAPPGKDGGIDLIAFQDHLGAMGPRIKVQVKRQQSTIGVELIRSFLGVLSDHDDIGLFISLGGFSADAEKEARTHSSKRLTLLDSQKFFDLWIEHYENLPQESRLLLPIRPVYYLAL
jgi:restriction system protein